MGFLDFLKGEKPVLVRQAFDDVKAMLDNGHEMFVTAAAHLLDNEILDVDLEALDEDIDRREQRVRRAVLDHLTADPNRELLLSLKLLSIVHEAERIGDLANTMSRMAALAHKPRMGPLVEPLRRSRYRILGQFDLVKTGFAEGDEAAARRLMKAHTQIKEGLTTYLQRLADHEAMTPNEGVVYGVAARTMSRVSSHLANVASTVACPFEEIRRSPAWVNDEVA